eukprot:2448820-Alexandrium_andersonii.AAC.1
MADHAAAEDRRQLRTKLLGPLEPAWEAAPRDGLQGRVACSSTRARRSRGWRRPGWRKSRNGARSRNAGAGWRARSSPRGGPSSQPPTAAPTAAGWPL